MSDLRDFQQLVPGEARAHATYVTISNHVH
jgi:hypothetical protein